MSTSQKLNIAMKTLYIIQVLHENTFDFLIWNIVTASRSLESISTICENSIITLYNSRKRDWSNSRSYRNSSSWVETTLNGIPYHSFQSRNLHLYNKTHKPHLWCVQVVPARNFERYVSGELHESLVIPGTSPQTYFLEFHSRITLSSPSPSP